MSLAQPLQVLLVIVGSMLGVWLVVKAVMGLGWALSQGFRFIGSLFGRVVAFASGMVRDALRFVGGCITAACFVPAIVLNVAFGRWSRANHFGQALEREATGVASAGYRLVIGHAARLFGLNSLTDGIEQRLPEVIARAPGPDQPRSRNDRFEGYAVVGSLPAGGSGARLFLAEPDDARRALLARTGMPVPRRVVIKSFSMGEGSTMPQIVRESRALEAARQLGLVLEHELTASRFHYVMPYVPGEDLSVATHRLHDEAGPDGLGPRQIQKVMSYGADLLQIMHRFHSHGLWHKDIKPSNIIVSEGRVHLVDLGLITPLRSAMTLTTHGTEYFRDPELVRLALRGVKVHEVDGVKFDIYGAGAVLYSMVEDSFPAHGSLSQISRKCPEALRWIVRRAMADMGKRYESSLEMHADLNALMEAPDPFAFAPARLPSMRERDPDTNVAAAASFGPDPRTPGMAASGPLSDAAPLPLPRSRATTPHAESTADRFRREGVRWGAAAGLVFTMAASAVVAFLFVRTDGFSHDGGLVESWVEVTGHAPAPSPAQDSSITHTHGVSSRGRAVALPEAAEVAAAVIASGAGEPPAPPPFGMRTDDASPPSSLARSLAAHRAERHVLLVLDDINESSGMRPTVQDIYGDLETAHFDLILPGSDAFADESRLELAAGARASIGVSGVHDADPTVLTRLSDFLAARHASVDGVLWIGHGRSTGAVSGRLIVLDGTDREDVARLLATHHDVELRSSRVVSLTH